MDASTNPAQSSEESGSKLWSHSPVSNGQDAPIVVDLTPIEKQGYELAGNAPDENVAMQIEIVLTTTGSFTPGSVTFLAEKLTKAALAARAKIQAATAFSIRVVEEGKAPSKAKKPSSKGTKTSANSPSPQTK